MIKVGVSGEGSRTQELKGLELLILILHFLALQP